MALNEEDGNQSEDVSLWDKMMTLPQYLIPQHTLSLFMYRLTRCEVVWFKNVFIRFITRQYKVNMAEAAETDLATYPSFNAFFTRLLKEGVRPIADIDIV